MASLYDAGWRQGSVLQATLHSAVTVINVGELDNVARTFTAWMIVTQDCDLADQEEDATEAEIELRPLFRNETPPMFGIRSRKLRVCHGRPDFLIAASPRCMISPQALTLLLASGANREDWLDDDELLALKIWLGLRYDRPAVPTTLVDLARSIAQRVHERRNQPPIASIKDVLVQFDQSVSPPQFRLIGVVDASADRDAVRNLLIDAGNAVPSNLGVLRLVDVGTTGEISIDVLQTSYAADVSQITWRTGRSGGST